VRFLVDQGLSPEIAHELRALGHDVGHVMDIGFESARDEAILAHPTSDDRTVLTSDLDFVELASQSPRAEACIILFRMQRLKPSVVVHRTLDIADQDGRRLAAGAIVSVDAVRHRISDRSDREGFSK
jgi:predicted nuclease of predicted toxin-antitoxin system